MNSKLHTDPEKEMSLIDIGVILYLKRFKILILMILFLLTGVLLKGIPSQFEQIESLIKIGTYNSRTSIEDPDSIGYMIQHSYLPKALSGKAIAISTQPVGPNGKFIKLATPLNGLNVEEIIQAHNNVILQIIEDHNKLLIKPQITGNELTHFTTPTEKIYIGKMRIISEWNTKLILKFIFLAFLSFLTAVTTILFWDYLKKVKLEAMEN